MRRTASLMPHQHTNPPTNPPTMSILTDEMLQAAFDFRAAEPWKALTDSDVFALQLTSGDIAYIVVMGNASEHYALGLYVGALEFRSYLLSLVMNDMETDDIQEAAMTFLRSPLALPTNTTGPWFSNRLLLASGTACIVGFIPPPCPRSILSIRRAARRRRL